MWKIGVGMGVAALFVWRCAGDKPEFSTDHQNADHGDDADLFGADASMVPAAAGEDVDVAAEEVSREDPQQEDLVGMGNECDRDADCDIEAPLCQLGVCVCPKDAIELAQDSDNCGACGNDCTVDSPNGICAGGTCVVSAQCGDSLVEEAEACDPPDGVSCSDACALITCGDGLVEGQEQCDDGNTNNTDECSATCTLPVCGNSIVEGSEGCDDGNDIDADECTNACTVPGCGDMEVEGVETCDPPDGKSCSSACQLIVCGDAVAEGEEQCDDGNSDESDACTVDCEFRCEGGGVPAAVDRCDRDGDDSNCDGVPNEGCACVVGEGSTCGEVHGSEGDCAAIEISCVGNGTWPTAVNCTSSVDELCNDDGRDENCNGLVDEGCQCLVGETTSCGEQYDSIGDCEGRTISCAQDGSWPTEAEGCAPGAGDDCDMNSGMGGAGGMGSNGAGGLSGTGGSGD